MNVDRMREHARQMGATPEAMTRMGLDDAEEQASAGVTLLEPNLPAFLLFAACDKQWETSIAPDGKFIRHGLRWPDVETRARYMPECRALDEQQTDQLWIDITTMQNAALTYQSERLARERKH